MISFYLEVFFVYILPHVHRIMCCTFFMKFLNNTCRYKVDIIMETQEVYLSIEHR